MESIWSATGKLPHFPPLWGEVHTDVLVIGGGMVGLLCAHQLHQASWQKRMCLPVALPKTPRQKLRLSML